MHVSGRKKDTVSPVLIDAWAATRVTVAYEDWKMLHESTISQHRHSSEMFATFRRRTQLINIVVSIRQTVAVKEVVA